jgi:ABC-type polysaccharide/polyol phosphate export permease
MPQFATLLRDWSASLSLYALWGNLALEDLRDRYRRTALGLVWIVLSFALFVGVKFFVFGPLNPASAAEFGVYVTLGFGLWTYINAMVTDACTAYMHSRAWILGTSTPYPVYLLQSIARNWLAFGMVLAVMAVSLYWNPLPITWRALWALPGLAIYLVTSVWVCAILAPLCARWRDLYQTLQVGLRLMFFVTPILWMPSTFERLALISELNPLSHFIAIIRDPLMYDRVPAGSWLLVLAINVVGLASGALVYSATRRRLPHWV